MRSERMVAQLEKLERQAKYVIAETYSLPNVSEFHDMSHDIAPEQLWDNIVVNNSHLSMYENKLGEVRELYRELKWAYELALQEALANQPKTSSKSTVKEREAKILSEDDQLYESSRVLHRLSGRIERLEGIRSSYKALSDAASRLVTVRQMDLELSRTRRMMGE